MEALTSQIYSSIKNQILSNQLPVGKKLNIVQLARQYHVSRTPVAAALDLLEKEGLIWRPIGRQAVVMPPARDDIARIYSYRMLIEPLVASEALPYVNVEELQEMRRDLIKMMQSEYSRETAMEFDQRIHSIFWNSLPSPSTEILYKAIQECSIRVQSVAIYSMNGETTNNEEHLRILDAAILGDPERTAAELRNHISRTCENVLRNLDNEKSFRKE